MHALQAISDTSDVCLQLRPPGPHRLLALGYAIRVLVIKEHRAIMSPLLGGLDHRFESVDLGLEDADLAIRPGQRVGDEGLALGAIDRITLGILAGIALSYGFTLAISSIGWALPYSFPIGGLIAALVLGVVLALLASILPARNAAKLDIIRALQYE